MVGFFTSVGNDVKNFVLSAVNKVLTTVSGWFDDVYRWAGEEIYGLAESVWARIDQAYNDVRGWVDDALHTAAGWISDVYRWAGDAIGAVESFARDVLSWAEQAVDQLTRWAQDAVSFLWHQLIDPLWQWVEHAADFVWHIITSWWDTIYRDVIAPIIAGLTWLLDQVPKALDFLWHDVLDVVHLVQKAWKWLVWMAEHDFDFFRGLLEGMPGPGSTIEHALSSAEAGHYTDVLGEAFDRILS